MQKSIYRYIYISLNLYILLDKSIYSYIYLYIPILWQQVTYNNPSFVSGKVVLPFPRILYISSRFSTSQCTYAILALQKSGTTVRCLQLPQHALSWASPAVHNNFQYQFTIHQIFSHHNSLTTTINPTKYTHGDSNG